jgi:dipeptidase D
MDNIRDLEPKGIWGYFSEITKVPRPSKHEGAMVEYLEGFAKKQNLSFKKDKAGNVLISKPAGKGLENRSVIVLQGHLDMVCEKNSDSNHNFLTDPIKAYIDGDWIKATGTTLGADDGIGIAAMMALLADNTIAHGPLECLFTIDEETGLTGAFDLEPGFITGKTLINLDSEDEGEIFIGCAGGKDTVAYFPIHYVPCAHNGRGYTIRITGLKGGHSGDDIHRNLGNAIKIMNEFLLLVDAQIKIGLHRFEGGNLRNAIPREAFASIMVDVSNVDKLTDIFTQYKQKLIEKWNATEPGLQFSIDSINNPLQCLERKLQDQILESIQQVPNGVIAWEKNIADLVETSTNLASVKFTPDNQIEITTSQRSSSDCEKIRIVEDVAQVFIKNGATISHSKGYPGWTPNVNSSILKIAVENYQKLFHSQPRVKAIHAGLECGLFLEKSSGLDMISIGPTIKGVHSPDERLQISSVTKFWEHLISIIQ